MLMALTGGGGGGASNDGQGVMLMNFIMTTDTSSFYWLCLIQLRNFCSTAYWCI